MIPSKKPTAFVSNGRVASLLSSLFVGWVLVIVPLTLPPSLLAGGDLVSEDFAQFRAVILGLSLALGLVTYLLVSVSRLERLDVRAVPAWAWFLCLLIAWLLIATLFPSSSPWARALGSPDRFDGTVMQAGWFSLVFVAFGVVRQARIGDRIVLLGLVTTGILTSGWAFLQGLGRDPLTWLTGFAFNVPAGAFGHGAFASIYIAMVLLVVAVEWLRSERTSVPFAIAVVTLGLGMASTAGRSGFAALLFGLLLVAATMVRSRGSAMRMGALVVLLAAGMLPPFFTVERTQRQAASAADALVGSDLSLNARLVAWQGGMRLLLANPLTGVGPGGFGYDVWSHLDATEKAVMIQDPLGHLLEGVDLTTEPYVISGDAIVIANAEGRLVMSNLGWDKAHNYLLDLGLLAGLLAPFLYLAFLIALVIRLWGSRSTLRKGLAVGMVAFAVFGLAWFGAIGLDPTVWALAGVGLGLSEAGSS